MLNKCATNDVECVVNKRTPWHLRLGHVRMSKLKYIVDINEVSNDKICLTCPMLKFFKLPFSLKNTRATHIFEIINLDILGPYRVPTHKNCMYFMTLVAGESRSTWTYLMQQKSQALQLPKTFHHYVETVSYTHLTLPTKRIV